MAIINFILLKKNLNLPREVAQVSPFVEHMKLITGANTPPWMEIALAEAKAATTMREGL